MNVEEFCQRFGSNTRKINDVMHEWHVEELDKLLKILHDDHDQLIGGAVILGDAWHGDGLRDHIPGELKNAFVNLMGEKADTYEEMRRILFEKIRDNDSGFLSFDNDHVEGWISYLKGQIGENAFQRHVGTAAHLAPLRNQPAWDISVDQPNGIREYVQVKLYTDPSDVIDEMRTVQEKVANGVVHGFGGETVRHIKFAVPEDIAGEVRQLVAGDPELLSMVHEQTIPVTASEGADLVKEGLVNVGPGELGHFFHELLGGAVAAGSLHAIVNGFLWYKGAKEFSGAFADFTASTTITTTGIGMGLVAETLFDAVTLGGAVGIGSRFLLARLARSRWGFAEFLERSIDCAEARIDALERIAPASPAA